MIFDGEEYLKGKHLKSIRSKDIRFKKYELMKDDVLIGPDEVFEIYIDLDSALNLEPKLCIFISYFVKKGIGNFGS